MNTLLYLHGYRTRFNPQGDKIQTLSPHWNVVGKTWDWDRESHTLKRELLQMVTEIQPDFILGSSLGGYWGAVIGTEVGLPFVAINPAIEPHEVVEGEFEPFPDRGKGLILLDRGDRVISPWRTWGRFKDTHTIHMFGGGNHRFQHMEASIDLIKIFLERG